MSVNEIIAEIEAGLDERSLSFWRAQGWEAKMEAVVGVLSGYATVADVIERETYPKMVTVCCNEKCAARLEWNTHSHDVVRFGAKHKGWIEIKDKTGRYCVGWLCPACGHLLAEKTELEWMISRELGIIDKMSLQARLEKVEGQLDLRLLEEEKS